MSYTREAEREAREAKAAAAGAVLRDAGLEIGERERVTLTVDNRVYTQLFLT